MCNLLQWNEIYCFQKFLPLLTRWQCTHNDYKNDLKLYGSISPKYIKKKRVPKGILLFSFNNFSIYSIYDVWTLYFIKIYYA